MQIALLGCFGTKKKMRHRSSHRSYSIKNVFWNISQNLQENTCAQVSPQIKLYAEARNPTNPSPGPLPRTSPWGGLGGGSGIKLPPSCLKFVRTMLESPNLAVSTHTYEVSVNIPLSKRALLILLMSAFFLQKISVFWPKQYFYSKQ